QAAIDKGYFAEQGLDVQILEGTGSGVALQLVANGQQPLGLIDAAVLASGVQKGIDARMVACMFQRSMWGILSPADNPLKQPADLIGKTIAVTPGGVAAVLFPAFAKKAGIDVSQVTLASLDPPSQPAALLSRRVDGAVHQVPTDALIYEGQNFPV